MKKNRRMKVSLGVCLVLILGMLASFFMATPRVAIAAEATTWRYMTIQPPVTLPSVQEKKAFDKITELTKGRIKFQVHYGMESGIQSKQYIGALEKGVMDGGTVLLGNLDFRWIGAYSIPFLLPDIKVREPMMEPTRPMLNEFFDEHGIVPLAYPILSDHYLTLYLKKDAKSLADFKGRLIRCFDENSIRIAKALGAVPTSTQKSEIYMGLQKGTIDGAISGDTGAKDLHLDEVSKYVFPICPQLIPTAIAINKKSWDKVSAEDQKIVRNYMKEWEKNYWSIMNDPSRKANVFDYHLSHGMTVIDQSDDVKASFSSLRNSMIQEFLTNKDKDARSKQIVNLMMEALKKEGY